MNRVSQKNLFIKELEAEQFFRSITPTEEKYRILLLLVCNGTRGGEAVRLHINDFVTPDCGQFYVYNTKVARNGKRPRRDLKILPSWIAREVRSYIKKQYELNLLKGGYLFPTNKFMRQGHMKYDSFIAWFAEKRKKLGFTEVVDYKPAPPKLRSKGILKVPQYRISIYSFRRFMATEEAKRGTPQQFTAARMGHLDTRTTSIYVNRQAIFEMLPQIVERSSVRFPSFAQQRLTAFFGEKSLNSAAAT